jgi:hypothetical protein
MPAPTSHPINSAVSRREDVMEAAIYNPNDRPTEDLPRIYGFNNGGSRGWYNGVLMADDGAVLGGHVCSHESYMPYDLGIISAIVGASACFVLTLILLARGA